MATGFGEDQGEGEGHRAAKPIWLMTGQSKKGVAHGGEETGERMTKKRSLRTFCQLDRREKYKGHEGRPVKGERKGVGFLSEKKSDSIVSLARNYA